MRRAAALLLAGSLAAPSALAQEVAVYRGLCDASAAVALGPELYVVANDERNQLRIYRRGQPDAVDSVDLSNFLRTKKDKESDLEGAAAIGQRIYWISSHGRNKKGEVQDRRLRFFATDIHAGAKPMLKPAGAAYTDLLHDLVRSAELKPYKLADAARLGPEAPGGFNIEGLAATPEGHLLIGLRNPLPQAKALLLPLLNPDKVVLDGKKAKFGAPIALDLGGRGVRSIERVGASYLIVAGPPADSGDFALYRWSGKPDEAAVRLAQVDFKTLRPEALFAIPNSDTVQVLSDDGGVEIDGKACKDQDEARQSFRSITVKP
jgi:hypothetical protein